MSVTLPRFVPREMPSADELNNILNVIERSLRVTAQPPLQVTQGTYGMTLGMASTEFFAVITEAPATSSDGTFKPSHGFAEVVAYGEGGFSILPDGRTGRAYELNGGNVAVGYVVWMRPGANSEWVFEYCCGGGSVLTYVGSSSSSSSSHSISSSSSSHSSSSLPSVSSGSSVPSIGSSSGTSGSSLSLSSSSSSHSSSSVSGSLSSASVSLSSSSLSSCPSCTSGTTSLQVLRDIDISCVGGNLIVTKHYATLCLPSSISVCI